MVLGVSMVRCADCHATIPVPDELSARTMKCQYCGAVQAVPDLAAREHSLMQRRHAELAEQQQRADVARHQAQLARDAQRDVLERKERRSGVRWGRVVTLFSMLLAPTIIAITVFDLPARLGFGAAGADRLKIVATQLSERGCTVLVQPASLYSGGTVSRLVTVESSGQLTCLRALAAGGPDHTSLTVRIFDLDGKQVAKSESSSDPQAEYCAPAAGSLRYEVVPGVAAKGRLTHMALSCPSAAPSEKSDSEPEGRTKRPRR
jgi:hypothetical protein